jgi:hypothetical protein
MGTLPEKLTGSILFVLTVLGGMVSLLTLYPRVTATVSFEMENPISSSFLVSNDGYLPVYSVSTACLLGIVATEPAHPSEPEIEAARAFQTILKNTSLPTVTLDPGAREAIPVSNCLNVGSPAILSFVDIGLRVTYRPLLWPSDRNFTQELYAQRLANGQFFWYSVPYAK